MHKLHHLPDPTTAFVVTKTLQGIRNQNTTSAPQLLPITKQILHNLLAALPFAVTTPYQLSLWRALFLLTFHACLRAGEVTLANNPNNLLQRSQLHLTTNNLRLQFKQYKHSHGATPTIMVNADPTSPNCPVAAMRQYLVNRGQHPGPLFIHPDKSAITRLQFSLILKSTATMCSLQAARYNTHSFRIGRATQMATDGQSDQTIRSAGRWRSTAYQRYIRPTEVLLPR